VRRTAILDPRATATLDDYVVDAAWAPDGRALVVVGGEGRTFLLAPRDLEARGAALDVRPLPAHGMGGLACAWSPKGDVFATSGQDNAVVLRAASDGGERARLRPGMGWSEHLAFSPDGARLAIATGKALALWSAADGALQHRFEPLGGAIAALAWDKPGRDLGAAINGGVVVHRVEGTTFARRHYKWSGQCLTVAFSPNGRTLATGLQDGSVHFWYLGSGKDSQMRGYPSRVNLTSWSGDGRYLATNAGPDVVVWDFGGRGPEGSRPVQLRGHSDALECLAFQPGGGYLVSAGRDWRLSLWQPAKAQVALDAHLTDSEASCLRWSPDGRYVAVGERKGRFTVFALDYPGGAAAR
jgi:WD40 repeat protein